MGLLWWDKHKLYSGAFWTVSLLAEHWFYWEVDLHDHCTPSCFCFYWFPPSYWASRHHSQGLCVPRKCQSIMWLRKSRIAQITLSSVAFIIEWFITKKKFFCKNLNRSVKKVKSYHCVVLQCCSMFFVGSI